jgi:hypothetical protein
MIAIHGEDARACHTNPGMIPDEYSLFYIIGTKSQSCLVGDKVAVG